MRNSIVLIITNVLGLYGCSNVVLSPKVQSLSTQEVSSQYYYCESCNQPTKLSIQDYQPLQPDTVVFPVATVIPIASLPEVKSTQVKKYKRRSLPHKSHQKKTQAHKNNQCLKWRTT